MRQVEAVKCQRNNCERVGDCAVVIECWIVGLPDPILVEPGLSLCATHAADVDVRWFLGPVREAGYNVDHVSRRIEQRAEA